MKDVCIVTDSSVQFPKPNFLGRELVNIINLDVCIEGQIFSSYDSIKAKQLPKTALDGHKPYLIPPDTEMLRAHFVNLSHRYEFLFAIFLSKDLCSLYHNAFEACESLKGKVNIQIIDSKTTSVGLGLLIHKLIEAVLEGEDLDQIDRKLRSLVPRLYTLLCVPSLSYLHYNGFIDKPQSIISEMLGIVPIFALEDGALTSIEKVKSLRHALSYFQEFLEEFDRIDHIAYIQSSKPNFKDAKLFHDSVKAVFPETTFSKHLINLPLSILFGPRSSGLIVLEQS